MQIINVIRACDDGKRTVIDPAKRRRIAVHRCGKDLKYGHDLGDTAIEICAAFRGERPEWLEVAKATNGQVPYTFMLGDAGEAWQCLPVYDLGPHARRWSDEAIGVAVIADPRVKPCNPAQYAVLISLCVELCSVFGIDPYEYDGIPRLAGHDELPHGTQNLNKRCPGEYLPMSVLRRDVGQMMREAALQRLLRGGLVL